MRQTSTTLLEPSELARMLGCTSYQYLYDVRFTGKLPDGSRVHIEVAPPDLRLLITMEKEVVPEYIATTAQGYFASEKATNIYNGGGK